MGVLRALEHMGLQPRGLVGVSMGAMVAATYALRPEDWYEALLAVDLDGSIEADQLTHQATTSPRSRMAPPFAPPFRAGPG